MAAVNLVTQTACQALSGRGQGRAFGNLHNQRTTLHCAGAATHRIRDGALRPIESVDSGDWGLVPMPSYGGAQNLLTPAQAEDLARWVLSMSPKQPYKPWRLSCGRTTFDHVVVASPAAVAARRLLNMSQCKLALGREQQLADPQSRPPEADGAGERLRKEVAKLKMERDILKKAAAYFAKDSL